MWLFLDKFAFMDADENGPGELVTMTFPLDENCHHSIEFHYLIYGQDAEFLYVEGYNFVVRQWERVYSVHRSGGKNPEQI